MKDYTITCDLCGEVIDYKNEKYHTFESVGVVDISKNEVLRYESHFCKSHNYVQLMISHDNHELDTVRALNDWLKANRWNPKENQ